MNKVVEFLNANPVQYLATVGRDGKAKCRPFMFAGEMDGKLWFCTNSTKDVYKDMQQNPEIEISVSSPEYVLPDGARQGVLCAACGAEVHRALGHAGKDYRFPARKGQKYWQRKAGRDF